MLPYKVQGRLTDGAAGSVMPQPASVLDPRSNGSDIRALMLSASLRFIKQHLRHWIKKQ